MWIQVICFLVLLALTAYGVWRFRKIRQLPEKRLYAAFWLWPCSWFLFMNFMPSWYLPTWLFNAVLGLVLCCMALDFFYFFGLRSSSSASRQWLHLLWLIPCLLVGFRHLGAQGPVLTVPTYGKSLVWTSSLVNPDRFYFLDPATKSNAGRENDYDDPNFGKAVFAPASGTLVRLDEQNYLHIRTGEPQLLMALGPLIPESVTLKPGDQILADMPVGLQDRDPDRSIPGLALKILEGGPVRFKQVYSGRYFPTETATTVLRRNHFVLNRSPNKGRWN